MRSLPHGALRSRLLPDDEARVRSIVASTGFFSTEEEDIAVELVAERRAREDASGYHFLFLDQAEASVAYACFGPIPGTDHSYDLYWIAVHRSAQRGGIGRALMAAAEKAIWALGGRRVYVDTSSREQYAPTRAFYERCGYVRAALLEDFYRAGDGKVVYVKVLPAGGEA
jgi:ribosomal protein S18 acetylase RimI-like enzyme